MAEVFLFCRMITEEKDILTNGGKQMEASILLEYGWVLLILVALEGILAADNAVVMAVMVKHLPKDQQRKALFYGLLGAFVFRFLSLLVISYLVNVWQIQAIGAFIYSLLRLIIYTKDIKRKISKDMYWRLRQSLKNNLVSG